MRSFEERFGETAIRQGDWFAVPLPRSTGPKALLEAVGLIDPTESSVPSAISLHQTPKSGGISLNRTRHTLANGWAGTGGRLILGEGVLTAPDHEDKILSGPHAFFQTAHLLRPQEAD